MQLPNVSEWGECTKLCGRGVQLRLVGDIEENRTCNEQPCHDEICLSGKYSIIWCLKVHVVILPNTINLQLPEHLLMKSLLGHVH